MLHGESGRFNATTISKIMEWDWSGTYGNDPQVQVRLKQHLAYLLALKSMESSVIMGVDGISCISSIG